MNISIKRQGDMSFSSLGLSDKVLAAVEAAGYTEPTAIQSGAIPHVLERRDVLGIAQTGTGKTASFTLPMLTLLERGRARARMPRTLILEPTRELAAQVEENFNKYGANLRLNVALLIGGTSFGDQDRKLQRGVDVLIATPGRLLDHAERGKLLMQGVEILVIDEADRMLDMGFIPDIERICKLIPSQRQTLFFSATMPPEIQKLADAFLMDPARIEVAKASSTADTVKQVIVAAPGQDYDKRAVLRELIKNAENLKNAIVFCNRKRDVATLFRSLEKHGFSVGALHGDMDQRSRTTMLDNFRKGTIPLLVASDVAARGLDIPDVSHVFNYDLPSHAEDYVHRIGRTGRAGRTGVAMSLVAGNDAKYLAAIEKVIGNSLEWQGEPLDFEAAAAERKSRKPRGSGAGRGRTSSASEPTSQDASSGKKQEARKKEQAHTPIAGLGDQPDVQPASKTPTRARAERNKRESPNRSINNNRGRNERDDHPVIGLGDHVPAFLLRDPRAKKAV